MTIKQQNKTELSAIWKELRLQALLMFLILGGMWTLTLLDQWVDAINFAKIGLQPRTLDSIPAIFYMHVLHLNVTHMAVCTVPFLVMGWLVMLRDTRDFIVVSLASMIVSGGAMWLFGQGTIACGALDVHWVGSGALIMGYAGCLLSRAIFERNWLSMIVAGVVMFFFGGAIMTLLNPLTTNAFAAYVAAFMAGLLTTRFMSRFFKEHLTKSVTDA